MALDAGASRWVAGVLIASVSQVASGELEEHILEVRPTVQRAQLGMRLQRGQQRAGLADYTPCCQQQDGAGPIDRFRKRPQEADAVGGRFDRFPPAVTRPSTYGMPWFIEKENAVAAATRRFAGSRTGTYSGIPSGCKTRRSTRSKGARAAVDLVRASLSREATEFRFRKCLR
jgi:hypothetical protein